MSEEPWSEWLDFDINRIRSVPESSGVFVMHASMKIMYIGGSENIRHALLERLSDPCTGKAKRFRYLLTPSFAEKSDQMLKEYAQKHAGKPPLCMEKG
jgi:hypothetical protein